MADDPDQPRKFYQLKPKEFEQVNTIMPGAVAQPPSPSAPDAGPSAGDDQRRIDVRELIQQGAQGIPLLGHNQPGNRPNDVHAVLKAQYEHDKAAGLFDVSPGSDKARRQRIRNYWIAMLAWNGPCGAAAFMAGPNNPIPFVFAIAGAALFSSYLTWQTFFLRTER